jgi:hypothetical protein
MGRDNTWAETMTEKPKEPQSQPPKQPPEEPETGPAGPRTPYPVDEPPDSRGPGSEPDYFPGKPTGGDLPKI